MPVRVQMGKLPNGDYGLRVVASDGSTIIIDGGSNMFKISATGTLSLTQAADSSGTTSTTLSGLGALSTTPAHLSFVSDGNAVSSRQHVGAHLLWQPPTSSFIATASGGPVDFDAGAILVGAVMSTELDGSSFCKVVFLIRNYTPSSVTWYGRYYVLKEIAL